MPTNVRVNITRSAGAFKFVLFAPHLPDAGQPLADRQPWPVAAELVEQLRRGEIGAAELDQLQDQASAWTLGPDLDLALTQQIGQAKANGDSVRLIWGVAPEALEDLTDVPFELIRPKHGGIPYVNNPRVVSFTHLLPKAGTPPNSPLARSWPFRCLVVRSNPLDLGGGVPLALPLRTAILQMAPAANAIQVCSSVTVI
jgi:hypothetical protein